MDVGGRPDGPDLAGGLLRCHERGCADHLAGPRQRGVGVEEAGQAEISDLRLVARRQQHVAGFQVAVDDAALVGQVHGAGQALDQAHRPAGLLRLAGQPVAERPTLHHLHRKERPAVHLAQIEHLDDVGMVQGGDGLSLGAETSDGVGVALPVRQQHLDRDQAVEAQLPGAIHDAHGPHSQRAGTS